MTCSTQVLELFWVLELLFFEDFGTNRSKEAFLDAFSHLYKRVCPSVRPSEILRDRINKNSGTLEKRPLWNDLFQNPQKKAIPEPKKVPELVCCRSFRKWPIWSVPEWGCCWWFWNSQKQSVPESQKNNVLGMFLVLKTAFFCHSGILKKQRFQNP